MRVLLTGGSGQLGSAIRRAAPDRWDILAPGRERLDMADPERLATAVREARPALVINAAALHLVDVCEADFAQALAVNAVAVQALARAAEAVGARFVTVSTDYAFDGARREPYRESDAANPLQCYGISKVAGERAALTAHPEGATVIRTCGLYGDPPSRQKGNFVVNRLREAEGRARLEVGSDLTCTPTSAVDLAAATIRLAETGAPAGLYHLTNAGSCDWATFTAEIFRAAGFAAEVTPVDRRGAYAPARPAYSVLDCSKAKGAGIVLRDWRDAVGEYVQRL